MTLHFEPTETPYMIFRPREIEGMYEFVMLESSRKAVDEWIAKIDEIWTVHSETRVPMGMIVDGSQVGDQPLRYAFQRGIEMVRKHNNIPRGRTVFIMQPSAMVNLLDTFLRLLRFNWEYRYLSVDERDEAEAWVKEILPVEDSEIEARKH